MTSETDTRELIDTGAVLAAPDYVGVENESEIAAVYTLPGGYETHVVDLEKLRAPYRSGPIRKAGVYLTTDVASFLAYFAKHGHEESEIWVEDTSVTAVLDAHADLAAAWEKHRVVLSLRHSPEWIRWSQRSGKYLTQELFAEFIEDAAADVHTPDAATMLEVAQSLQAHTRADFKSAYRTTDGQRAFRYEETTTAKAGAKGELEIPERLTLRLRVFLGQEPVEVRARFRYRINDSGLALGFALERVEDVVEAARDRVVQEITDGTKTGLVLRGTTAGR